MTTSLELKQVTHRFGKKVALDKVSLSVAKTGVTALLGANGAGKSTLINCALGLIKPSSGDIHLFGMRPGDSNVKQSIGVMLQDSGLPDLLTAQEHIQLFQSYYKNPLSIDEVSERCNLGGFIDQRYKKLSGGQKRRVQFALAILGRPKVVFLDEPTSGLDIQARKIVWNTISDLANTGTAVVLTTHYLEEADLLANHTIVLSKGRVVADDTTANIRAAANGAIIVCETALSEEKVNKIKHVHAVSRLGIGLKIATSDASACLQELFKFDPLLSNLTVSKPSLEDAFVQLSSTQETHNTHSGKEINQEDSKPEEQYERTTM